MAGKTPRKSAKKIAKRPAASRPRKAAAKTRARKTTKAAAAETSGRKSVRSIKATDAEASVRAAKPKLLSGGNPQIPKGEGDAPVQAYIAAMPGWKSGVGRQLDQLIERAVPRVRKAVKWNSPFYGSEGGDWFVSFHCFTRYIKVSFFNGAALRPPPPGESKQEKVRYLDIHENDALDEKQFIAWVKQASRLPGWAMGKS